MKLYFITGEKKSIFFRFHDFSEYGFQCFADFPCHALHTDIVRMHVIHRTRIGVVFIVEILTADKINVFVAVFQGVFVGRANDGKTRFAILFFDAVIGIGSMMMGSVGFFSRMI